MPNSLPGLRGGSDQALYGFSRTVSFSTFVQIFMNGAEQRWPQRPPLYTFALPMTVLNATDRAAWLAFLGTVKGQLNQDLQIVLAGTTYANLTLLGDSIAALNQINLYSDQQVSLRQTQNGSWTPPTPLTAFPTFSWGGVAQMPFSQISTYATSVNDSANGPRYAYSWYGSGLATFPTGYLRMWKISYPLLSDADLATLENAFVGWMGRALSFSFTDPIDNTVYSHVRCDQDDLQIKYLTVNQNSTEILLRQTNGS